MRAGLILKVALLSALVLALTVPSGWAKRGRGDLREVVEKERKKKEHVQSVVKMRKAAGGTFRKVSEEDFDNNGRVKVNKTFDADEEVETEVEHEYDNKGRMKKSKNKKGKGGKPGRRPGNQATYGYLDDDNLAEFRTFADQDTTLDSLVVAVVYDYDTDGDVTGLMVSSGDSVFKSVEYNYTGVGDEKTLQNLSEFAGDGSTISEMQFEYDANGNKKKETRRDADGNIVSEEDYVYDAQGNIATRSSRGRARGTLLDVYEITNEYELDATDSTLAKKTTKTRQMGNGRETEVVTTYDVYGNECEQIEKNLETGETVGESVWDYKYRGTAKGRKCAGMTTSVQDRLRGSVR